LTDPEARVSRRGREKEGEIGRRKGEEEGDGKDFTFATN
jgi:hypothetical protein